MIKAIGWITVHALVAIAAIEVAGGLGDLTCWIEARRQRRDGTG